MKTQRLALYARVSSKRQNQERTIETQIAALRDYSEKHDDVIDEDLIFVDDGVSGATLERPGLDALRDRALKGDIDQILVLCPDRLARKHAHQLILVEEFQRLGVRIIFLNRPVSESPEDQLRLQIQGIIAEYEREKIKERSRRGNVYKANAGSVNVLSGAPYGYVYIRKTDTHEARYAIHPQQALIVQRIFHLYTVTCESIGAIARQLTAENVPSRTGKGYWERSSIWGMLKNSAYRGKAAFRKTRHVQREKLTKPTREHGGYSKHALSRSRDRPKEDWIFIPVPAIIDEQTFHIAQERLMVRHNIMIAMILGLRTLIILKTRGNLRRLYKKVFHCVRGVSTDPCGVPNSSALTSCPSSSTPAFSHFHNRRMTRGSLTRRCTNSISNDCRIESKYVEISVSITMS